MIAIERIIAVKCHGITSLNVSKELFFILSYYCLFFKLSLFILVDKHLHMLVTSVSWFVIIHPNVALHCLMLWQLTHFLTFSVIYKYGLRVGSFFYSSSLCCFLLSWGNPPFLGFCGCKEGL